MKFISLLRGINVSGQKKIKMIDLRALYESIGLTDVSTYIQSGNVIFSTHLKNVPEIKLAIESAIEKKYKFSIPVTILTNREIGEILNKNPFGAIDLERDGTKVLVSFLYEEPSPDRARNLRSYVHAPEKLVVVGKRVYLYCPNGYGKSKLNNSFLEKKLGLEATTRNLKTVKKLHDLTVS